MPTHTKAQIVERVADEIGHPKQQARDDVETLPGITKRTLESGEDVLVTGFGKFCVREKAERLGRFYPK